MIEAAQVITRTEAVQTYYDAVFRFNLGLRLAGWPDLEERLGEILAAGRELGEIVPSLTRRSIHNLAAYRSYQCHIGPASGEEALTIFNPDVDTLQI